MLEQDNYMPNTQQENVFEEEEEEGEPEEE